MTKKLCGPLTQRKLTKWPAIANRFVTSDIGRHASSSWYETFFEPTHMLHYDLGAGVQQPFDCFVIRCNQTIHSMGKSMDCTMEDSMVTCQFFCATLPGLVLQKDKIQFHQPH